MRIQRFIQVLAATLLVAMLAVGCADIHVRASKGDTEIEVNVRPPVVNDGHWDSTGPDRVCVTPGNVCKVKT